MFTQVMVPALHCVCDVCSYEWVSLAKPDKPPECCGSNKCRSKLWDGRKKQMTHVNEVKLPAPRRTGIKRGAHRPRTILLMTTEEQ